MTSRTMVRRLSLFLIALGCLASPLFASDISPRRRAEIDSLIARRRAERSDRNRGARAREYEDACALREARQYEVAMAQNIALAQTAVAQRELQAELAIVAVSRGPAGWSGWSGPYYGPIPCGSGLAGVAVAAPHEFHGHAESHGHGHHGH
jgi:hypothetical protein